MKLHEIYSEPVPLLYELIGRLPKNMSVYLQLASKDAGFNLFRLLKITTHNRVDAHLIYSRFSKSNVVQRKSVPLSTFDDEWELTKKTDTNGDYWVLHQIIFPAIDDYPEE